MAGAPSSRLSLTTCDSSGAVLGLAWVELRRARTGIVALVHTCTICIAANKALPGRAYHEENVLAMDIVVCGKSR